MKSSVILAAGILLGVAISILAVVIFACICYEDKSASLPQCRKDD